MFISKKPLKSNKQIKRTCFQHWKRLIEGNILDLPTSKKVFLRTQKQSKERKFRGCQEKNSNHGSFYGSRQKTERHRL